MALERGEVDAVALSVNGLMTQRAYWLEDGTANAVLIVGRNAEDRLPGVATFYDLVVTEEHRTVLDLFTAPGELGYAFSTPPGLPDHMLRALQEAMTDTVNDPEFQADADELGLDYEGSRSGTEIEEILAEVYSTSPQEIDLFNSYMQVD